MRTGRREGSWGMREGELKNQNWNMWFLFGVLHAEMWVWLVFTPACIYNVNIPLIINQQGCSHAPSMNTAGASLFSNHKVNGELFPSLECRRTFETSLSNFMHHIEKSAALTVLFVLTTRELISIRISERI